MCCEMPSVYGLETRKARKEHKCCECGGVIKVGEDYHYHHGIWDGRADSFKVCLDCDALREEVDKPIKYAEEKTAFEMLHESIDESQDAGLMARYVAICDKRGGKVADWMRERAAAANRPLDERRGG